MKIAMPLYSLTIIILCVTFSMNSFPNSPKQITKADAREIAGKVVAALSMQHNFVILEDRTVERPFGWVFFYTTREYIQTGDPKYLIPGTAPLVVNRDDGSTEHLATSIPPARAIEIYEKRWYEKKSASMLNEALKW